MYKYCMCQMSISYPVTRMILLLLHKTMAELRSSVIHVTMIRVMGYDCMAFIANKIIVGNYVCNNFLAG